MRTKEKEKYKFERFAAICPDMPSGEIEYSDKPDVIIRKGKEILGIELTDFFIEDGALSESEQKQRLFREQVVEKAHEEYLKSDGKRIELSFGFKRDYPIRDKKFKNLLIQNISNLAKIIENEKSGKVSRKVYKDIGELDFLYINSDEYNDPKWRVNQVYNVPLMSTERLSKIIKDKEVASKAYQKCDKLWLLITVDFMDFAQDQEINNDGIDQITSEVFDKVFIHKSVFNELKEIKCRTVQ